MSDEQFRNRRILVVDDEERMVRFIRLNLEHDGCSRSLKPSMAHRRE